MNPQADDRNHELRAWTCSAVLAAFEELFLVQHFEAVSLENNTTTSHGQHKILIAVLQHFSLALFPSPLLFQTPSTFLLTQPRSLFKPAPPRFARRHAPRVPWSQKQCQRVLRTEQGARVSFFTAASAVRHAIRPLRVLRVQRRPRAPSRACSASVRSTELSHFR